nr:unnamed protein product [Callosobruchus chinensis]
MPTVCVPIAVPATHRCRHTQTCIKQCVIPWAQQLPYTSARVNQRKNHFKVRAAKGAAQERDFLEDLEPVESDSENDDEQAETPVDIGWVENPSDMKNIPFIAEQGLNVNIPGEGLPIDFFLLLADDKFFDLLVNETNACG